MKVKDIQKVLLVPPSDEYFMRTVLSVEGVDCIIPPGVEVSDMSKFTEILVGKLTPGVTFNQNIRLNNYVLPWLSIETVVHECIHIYQERKMGKWGYALTYFWQCILTAFKSGPTHIHDDHIMEVEARRIAKNIAYSHDRTKQLDIEKAISEFYDIESVRVLNKNNKGAA